MYEVKNFMEQALKDKINHIIEELEVCNCEKCKADILAMALNSLPPKYVVSNKGDVFTRLSALEKQFEVNIMTALVQAAVKVKNNPQHSE